ncbi:putative lipoprotein, partial [Bordetella bronchiseptica F2]
MEPIHRRRDFLQRAGALLLSGTLLGGCAARRPAAPGPAAPAAG